MLSLFSDSLEKLKYAAICATIIGSPFIVIRAWAALKRFILDINVLLIIAVTGAIVIEEYAESAAIVFLFGLAEWLEDRCMRRARTAVGMLSELQPEFAVDAATGTTMPVGEVGSFTSSGGCSYKCKLFVSQRLYGGFKYITD